MMVSPMPAVFVGHGSPMNTLARNRYTEGWRNLGRSLPRPRSILAVSAHWYIDGSAATAMDEPRTIHDFMGFPEDLHAFRYPAPGDPALAARVRDLLAPVPVAMDDQWGLDHGTWSVLAHMYPEADVPVVQLAIDRGAPNELHYALGQTLAALRKEEVLILGLGNVVHNLRMMQRRPAAAPPDWAVAFNDHVRDCLTRHDHGALIDYESFGQAARLSVPTPEHYLPLLYVIGAQADDEPVWFPTDGIDMGSISMMSIVVGEPRPGVFAPEA
jgi:4,5-DOPA dioxygenase extradiol